MLPASPTSSVSSMSSISDTIFNSSCIFRGSNLKTSWFLLLSREANIKFIYPLNSHSSRAWPFCGALSKSSEVIRSGNFIVHCKDSLYLSKMAIQLLPKELSRRITGERCSEENPPTTRSLTMKPQCSVLLYIQSEPLAAWVRPQPVCSSQASPWAGLSLWVWTRVSFCQSAELLITQATR